MRITHRYISYLRIEIAIAGWGIFFCVVLFILVWESETFLMLTSSCKFESVYVHNFSYHSETKLAIFLNNLSNCIYIFYCSWSVWSFRTYIVFQFTESLVPLKRKCTKHAIFTVTLSEHLKTFRRCFV